MKGRTVPIIVQGVQPRDPSQDVDYAYFSQHPAAREYTRPYIRGETDEPMPPGTHVLVKRIGAAGRARAFMAPAEGLN